MADDFVTFTKKMLSNKVFNCAKCDKLLKPPIMFAEDMGNVCGSCLEKYSWKAFHNSKLDSVLVELKLPCKFQLTGCKEWTSFKELEQHQSNCKFQTKLCFMSSKGCNWEGIQTELCNHFIKSHSDHVISDADNYFVIELNLSEDIDLIKLLKNRNQSCIIKVIKDSNSISYSMWNMKNGNEAECSIKHIGENCVETKCKILSLNEVGGSNSTKIDLSALKLVTKAEDALKISVALPNPDLQALDEKMLQYFECPVCKNLMKPPIYQCKFGHSFCNICKPKLDKCPTCRGIFGSTRNYCLEGLTTGIQYACAYQNLGCEVTLAAGDTDKHETVCIYKPYPCPVVNDCSYQGNHSTIVAHLNEFHPEKVISASFYKTTAEFRLEQMMDFYNSCQRYFMIFDDNIFRLSFKRNSDYSFWAVEVLRNNDANANYSYEIGITDMRRQERKLIRTDTCFTEMSSEEIFKKCILFPNNILTSYASNGIFSYYCQIHKRLTENDTV